MNERMDERYGLDTPQEREREATELRAKYQALEKRNERMADLVHYARHYLHDENLIDDEELAALVTDAGQSVARLEGYDKLRKENAALKQQVADGDLAFNHANEVVAALEAQVARLSAPSESDETVPVWESPTAQAIISERDREWKAAIQDEGDRISWQGFGAEATFADAVHARLLASRTTPENEEDDPDACEGCDKPLREDEGHETEDMVILCDECWRELLDDLGWHSEECPCNTCIASRTTKEPK